MSHFYSEIMPSHRKNATSRGFKKDGLSAYVASWSGKVETDVWHDESAGVDRFRVSLRPHHGHGVSFMLVEGIVGQTKGLDFNKAQVPLGHLVTDAGYEEEASQ